MGNTYTGSNTGKAGLEVTEVDGTPDVFGVSKIIVSNGTLTDNGAGSVTITTGGGGGGGGTVTSVTPAADNGAGTAITGAGTITLTGGTGITTNVVGTTITITADGTVASGVANQVAFYTSATALGGDTGLTYIPTPGSRKLSITDTGASTMFEVRSTDAGGGTAPDIVFVRDSATPAAGDDLGVIVFKGNDDGGGEGEYGRISAEANSVAAGAENGQLDFRVFAAGSLGNQLRITETGVFVNVANDAVTDFVVDTDTTNNAFQVDASANTARFEVPLEIGASINSYQGSAPTNGQLLIGDTASGLFDKGTLTSTGGTVTITNGAGTINLEAAGGGGGTPAGANTQVQFNDGGAFGANGNIVIDDGNTRLGVGEATPTATLHVSSGTANIVAKFLSTDATASIELADNATTNNAVLTRVGQQLNLCANGGDIQIAAAATDKVGFFGATPVVQSSSVPDPTALPPPGAGNPNDAVIAANQSWLAALYTALRNYGLLG